MDKIKQSIYLLQGIIISIGILVLQSGCNEPTLVGTSIFDGDSLNINFTDTIDIQSKTIKGDSSIHTNARTYFIGTEVDPIFGKSTAELYLDIRREGTPAYKFIGTTIDSIVLSIRYDSLGFDLDMIKDQAIEIRKIIEKFPDTTFTDTKLNYEDVLLNMGGQATIIHPEPKKEVKIVDYLEDTVITLDPVMRIRLSDEFIDEYIEALTMDSLIVSNDTVFAKFMQGLYIRSSSTEEEASIFGLNFQSSSFLKVYYNAGDTSKYVYNFPVGLKRIANFTHDYAGYDIETFLENDEDSDSLVYVQGFSGTNIEVDMSAIASYEDKVLNYAELEFFVAEEFQEDRTEADILIAFYIDGEEFIQTIDARWGIQDGNITDDDEIGLKKYKIILTSQLKEFFRNSSLDRKVIISIYGKNAVTNKSIIYGTNHSKYPMKLRAVFTEP